MLVLIHTLQLPILKIYLKSETLWHAIRGRASRLRHGPTLSTVL